MRMDTAQPKRGLDIAKLSDSYRVRRLENSDAGAILALCLENTQYYQYCGKEPSLELILNDLRIAPPGVDVSDKYYVGFYDGPTLAAVMDLIDGYPNRDVGFIGFFMMKKQLQGRAIGSCIIREVCRYLRQTGKTAVQLGIDKGNPQSTRFWRKNGFRVIRELDRGDWTIQLAEKDLTDSPEAPPASAPGQGSGKKTVQVVAAVIRDGDRIFATQRGYGDWKDFWEFPGGKIEPGETPEAALIREIREELGAEIAVESHLTTVEYEYPAFHLFMGCYLARVTGGELTLKEHEAARWLTREELDTVAWLPADRTVIGLVRQAIQPA